MMAEAEGELTPPPPKRGRPPSIRGAMPIALTIRAGEPWRQWLDAYAKWKGESAAVLVEQALAQMAKRDKQPMPPSRSA